MRLVQHSGVGWSQIVLHPAVGALQGSEAAAPVDLMGVDGAQNHPVQTLDPQVFQDVAHQPGTEPESSVMLIDEHVTDLGKGGAVGDHTREGCLLSPGVHAVRARSGDRSLDHSAFAPPGPVGLLREPGVNSIDIDATGVGGQDVAFPSAIRPVRAGVH